MAWLKERTKRNRTNTRLEKRQRLPKSLTLSLATVIAIGLASCDSGDKPTVETTESPTAQNSATIKKQYNACMDNAETPKQPSAEVDTQLLSTVEGQKCLVEALKNCKSAIDALECQAAVNAINQRP